MLLEHDLVIHLVDVITRKNDHIFGRVVGNNVDILEHSVRRSHVPLSLREALAGWQNVETFIALGPEKIPAPLQMSDQRMSLVLGSDTNVTYTRVERV